MLDFSGTKWNTRGVEPVIVHDILSNDIPDLRDSNSLEIAAMMHGTKDDEDLLNSASELCLEQNMEQTDVLVKLHVEEWKSYDTLASNEAEACGTTEQEIKKKEPDDTCVGDEEEKSHSGPAGED